MMPRFGATARFKFQPSGLRYDDLKDQCDHGDEKTRLAAMSGRDVLDLDYEQSHNFATLAVAEKCAEEQLMARLLDSAECHHLKADVFMSKEGNFLLLDTPERHSASEAEAIAAQAPPILRHFPDLTKLMLLLQNRMATEARLREKNLISTESPTFELQYYLTRRPRHGEKLFAQLCSNEWPALNDWFKQLRQSVLAAEAGRPPSARASSPSPAHGVAS